MITSTVDKHVKLAAIEAGATEFLHKPFDDTELRIRVQNLLNIRSAQLSLAEQAVELNRKYEDAMARINRREEEIIWRLSKAIGIRDGDTGNHIDRVSYIAGMIAEELGLDQEFCRMIFLASPLHDVGKLGVPDSVLLKPSKLSADEFKEMQKHTELGAQILGGSSSKLIQIAETIAANHHEKWDGTGYPKGLKGTDIPIEARIVAIADVLDALCSDRPYKKAWPLDAAFAEILNASGKHFDPACVAAFCRRWPDIRQTFSPAQSNDTETVSEFNVGKNSMKTETAALSLNGPLTIKSIGSARDILQAFIGENAQSGKTLSLDIDDTMECDLTLVQLVISARKSVSARGAKLKLAKPAAGNFLTVIERMGVLTGDKKQDGFWMEGKAA